MWVTLARTTLRRWQGPHRWRGRPSHCLGRLVPFRRRTRSSAYRWKFRKATVVGARQGWGRRRPLHRRIRYPTTRSRIIWVHRVLRRCRLSFRLALSFVSGRRTSRTRQKRRTRSSSHDERLVPLREWDKVLRIGVGRSGSYALSRECHGRAGDE